MQQLIPQEVTSAQAIQVIPAEVITTAQPLVANPNAELLSPEAAQ